MGNAHAPGLHHGSGNILVLGSTGFIGKETIKELVKLHSDKAEKHKGEAGDGKTEKAAKIHVFAGMRNLEKAKASGFDEKSVKSVKVNHGDEADVAKCVKENHIEKVFIIPPGNIKREEIGVAAIKGAKKGGAKYVVLLSVLNVPYKGTTFSNQFAPIEEELKNSGLAYTILRYPLFMDNLLGQAKPIKETKKFYGCQDPSIKHAQVTTTDGGKAAAHVLFKPRGHKGHTYNVVSDVVSCNDVAKALSNATGNTIEYVKIPEGAVKESMSSMPEWQVNGIIELYKLIDLKLETMLTPGDLEKLGVTPTKVTDYFKAVGPMFKP